MASLAWQSWSSGTILFGIVAGVSLRECYERQEWKAAMCQGLALETAAESRRPYSLDQSSRSARLPPANLLSPSFTPQSRADSRACSMQGMTVNLQPSLICREAWKKENWGGLRKQNVLPMDSDRGVCRTAWALNRHVCAILHSSMCAVSPKKACPQWVRLSASLKNINKSPWRRPQSFPCWNGLVFARAEFSSVLLN